MNEIEQGDRVRLTSCRPTYTVIAEMGEVYVLIGDDCGVPILLRKSTLIGVQYDHEEDELRDLPNIKFWEKVDATV